MIDDDFELDDAEIFDPTGICWTMLRTKDLKRVTLVAKSDEPINAMALYLSLDAQLERWRRELGISEAANEVM